MKTDAVQFHTINLTSFFSQLAIAVINLTLVFHLRTHYALSSGLIGIAAAITPAFYLLFCLINGPIVARLKPVSAVLLALGGMSASIILLLSVHNLTITYLALFSFGFWMSLLWPSIEEWFSREKEGRELSKAANGFNVSWSLGVALSSYVAGLLVEHSTILSFAVGVGLFLSVFLGLVIIGRIVPELRSTVSEHIHIEQAGLKDQSTILRFYSWIGVIILYSGMSIILTIFPIYAHEELLLRESHVGLFLLIRGVTSSISFILLGKFAFWHFKKGWIFLVQLLFSLLSFSGIFFSSLKFYGIYFFLFGILFAFAYTQSIFHGASGAIKRSRRMVIHEVLLTIGTIIGSIGGGWFYQRFSFEGVLFAVGILAISAVAAQILFSVYNTHRIRYNEENNSQGGRHGSNLDGKNSR